MAQSCLLLNTHARRIAFTGRYRADHRPFVAFSPRTRLQPLCRSRTANEVPESEIAYAWLPIDASLFQAFLSRYPCFRIITAQPYIILRAVGTCRAHPDCARIRAHPDGCGLGASALPRTAVASAHPAIALPPISTAFASAASGRRE